MAIVALSLLVPMVAGTLLSLTSSIVRRRLAAITAIGALLAAGVLLAIVLARVQGGLMVVWWGGWAPRGAVVGIDFAIDPLGAGLALFVAVLAVPALVMAAYAIRASAQLFFGACLIFVAAMIGYSLTGDLFDLFVFFELMSVAAYVLVGYEVRSRGPLEGALTFAVTNSVGSILLLFGIALLYGRTGALNMAQMGLALRGGRCERDRLRGAGAGRHGAAGQGRRRAVSLLDRRRVRCGAHSGAHPARRRLLRVGLYGFARVYWTVFDPALAGHLDALRAIFVVLGLFSGLLGATMALTQHHLKRMLAFVVISQIGLFLVGIGLFSADGVVGTAIFLVGDGLAKAALFICVGVVQHRFDAVEEGALHGRARALWPLGVIYAIAALTIADLPPWGAFVGRALVDDAALKAGWRWVPAAMTLISALAAGALSRAGLRLFAGIGARAAQATRFERGDDQDRGDEQQRGAIVAPGLLAGALVLASLGWGLVPDLAHDVTAAAAHFVDAGGYAAVVLSGNAPATPVPHVHGPGRRPISTRSRPWGSRRWSRPWDWPDARDPWA